MAKRICFSVSSSDHARHLSFDLPRPVAYGLLAALIVIVPLFVMFSIRISTYYSNQDRLQDALTRNIFLEQAYSYIRSELEKVYNRVDQIERVQCKLKGEIGLPGEQGIGGITGLRERPKGFEKVYCSKDEELVRDLWVDLQYLEAGVTTLASTNYCLRDYFRRKDKLNSAIPSIRPLHGGWISSGFKVRRDPISGILRMHKGLDFSHLLNTPIFATASGRVSSCKRKKGFGKTIEIEHGFGFETLYAHLNKIMVVEGQQVQRGNVIGLLGSSGNSTGPHLHYEIHLEGRAINPHHFINGSDG